MISLNELLNDLNTYLQVDLFEDYCPNGLQIEGKKGIKNLAVAVSASLNIIEQAKHFDALIVHHGLFWMRDSFVIKGVKKEKIKILLENEVSLLAYHLPLDAHVEVGNNFKAAKDLKWNNLEKCLKIGVKGTFDPVTPEEFKKQLETYYNHPAHISSGGKEKISSAILISGGAHKELIRAAGEKVDAFITGSFDEPTYREAKEEGIDFFALGHAATETVGVKALAEYITNRFKIKTTYLSEDNPF